MAGGFAARRAGGFRGWRFLALLLVAGLVPSACVLWFMNEAVVHQSEAAGRAIIDAYRGQLRLVRGRVNGYWQTRAASLESELTRHPPAAFQHLVSKGAADSIILLDADGVPLYPAIAVPPENSARDSGASMRARAIQDAVRQVLQSGNRAAAIDIITREFGSRSARLGVDAEGRIIAADAHLLLINLLPASDRRRALALDRLTTAVNDYESWRLPSAQRLFLMEQLRSLAGTGPRFPTLAAERLAVAFLEQERPLRDGVALRPTASADVWQLSVPSGRAVALYRSDSVLSAMRGVVEEHGSTDVAFVVRRPGERADEEAVPLGPAAPGWEISFVMNDRSAFAHGASGRRRSYVAMATLAIGVVVGAVALLGGAARRQVRLASLKTDLVAAVSHELKTPLASMRLLVDALLEDEVFDPTKTRDYLRLMTAENARLSRLVDNFLMFSRLERNHQQFDFRLTRPSDVVEAAVLAIPEGWKAGSAPAVDVEPDLPAIMADQDALVTALLNLIDNACKYTPGERRISVRAFRDGTHVAFAVEDNGIGIPAREQKRIFRRFYRVDQRLARSTHGSGLGLSIVEAIVRAHGGSVRVSSRPNHGSTFSLYFPASAEGVVA